MLEHFISKIAQSAKLHAENQDFHEVFFSACVLPLSSKFGGRPAAKFSWLIIFFVRLVLSYFAEFLAGWQQCSRHLRTKLSVLHCAHVSSCLFI
jgi:uncharacterized MAPEG superfamily protein